jgi:serine protease Do
LGVLGILLLILLAPQVVEQFRFAWVRGAARAEAEVARDLLDGLPDPENRFRFAAKAIEPSVVGVEMIRLAGRSDGGGEWDAPGGAMGQGSGVIVDSAGFIVTNFHVISQASQINVRLSDGRTFRDVNVVGIDPGSDLAVLKISAAKLVAAPWGDSDKLEVGDPVLAIGSPFQLAQTVTSGIISAKDRRALPLPNVYQNFTQHDAAVNPGNSGGPLVNLKGEIVGINTAILGQTYRGISFAIPSNRAKEVYEKLKAGEQIVPGWLGIGMKDVTDAVADELKLPEARGVIVSQVLRNAPADKAGLEPLDVIVQWNGKQVNAASDLRFLVVGTQPGSVVPVVIYRNGKKQTLSITVGQMPMRYRMPRE